MKKFTIWRSGSGHINIWTTLPYCYGVYEADTFLDACNKATECLDKSEWDFSIIDGIMYIRNRYEDTHIQYGFFDNEEDTFAETLKYYTPTQLITDSIGNQAWADVVLYKNHAEICCKD